MTDAGFFRGTSAEQDNRFSDKEKKLMKQMRFGENTTKKVDMSKIKIDVLRPWISKRIEELLGMEDDVIEEFVVNQLEADNSPDGRRIQINLTGFLNGKNARIFTAELWDMLLSAQEQSTGIPASLIESKQEEIKKRNEEQEKERLNDTLKKTVSRFAEKLKTDPDSPSIHPSHSSSSNTASIKREKTTPDRERNNTREVDFSKRKDDGGRRQYRSRRTSSPSPSRRNSRSRSRSRDRARDRDRDRDRDRRDRDFRRDRSRERDRRPPRSPPSKVRRSPLMLRPSYRDRDRSRSRSRDRMERSSASSANRRYSDNFDRDRERGDRGRDSGRRLEEPRGGFGGGGGRERDDRDYAQNGKSYRQQLSPSPPRREKRRISRSPEERESGDFRRRGSEVEPEEDVVEQDHSEQEQDQSNDSGQDEPQVKKARKEKKSKKDKKKHKKHKKTKKSKKSKNGSGGGSTEEEEENEENNEGTRSEEGDDSDEVQQQSRGSSYLKGTLYNPQVSDDLERKLRERALESLKKATTSSH